MLKKLLMHPKLHYLTFHIPTVPYIAWLSLKSRTPFFYTACNPITPYDGGKRTSKSEMLSHFDDAFLPRTVIIKPGTSAADAVAEVRALGVDFPMIAKPDFGERGRGVVKVESVEALDDYLSDEPGQVILQELVDWPIEAGVLYVRYPDQEKGFITSISIKRMPGVVGDGRHTVAELADRDFRLKLYQEAYRTRWGSRMDQVLPEGEYFQLHYIGQQNTGTVFGDHRHLITPEVESVFDRMCKPVPGFFLGRLDLKAESEDSLRTGKGLRILELNGTASMPLHIWDPKVSAIDTYRGMFQHWRHIYEVCKRNRKLGVKPIGLRDALIYLKAHFKQADTIEKAGANAQRRAGATDRPDTAP